MRRRLILVSAAVTTMVVLAFLIPLAILVRDLAADRALTRAEREAEAVARFIAVLAPSQGIEGAVQAIGGDELRGFDVSVALPDGSVIGNPIPEDEDLAEARAGSAFRAVVPGGEAVYVPVIQPDGATLVVRVLVPGAVIFEGVAWSWVTLGLLGLVLIGLAIVVSDRLARSVVVPVRDLSEKAERLGEGDLTARVEPGGPEEIRDVGLEFNRLAGQIGRLLQEEREMAADLSHRLRTPLTAIRLDAEALPAGARRQQLLADLDELDRTVDHLIREARRPVRRGTDDACDLGEVAAERVAFWSVLAEEQRRHVMVDLDGGPARVPIPRADAEAMVDALLGNVFAHTAEGDAFSVGLDHDGESVRLSVEDAGPGFPAGPVLERGQSGGASTGLGLDIARRTAEAAGGSIAIGPGPQLGGAVVAVAVPVSAGDRDAAGAGRGRSRAS